MLKRSLTLLETLIALALVAALAALVIPALVETLDEQAFESAADVTNEQLLLARAHAQTTGTPVEVTYDAQKSRVQARFFMPGAPIGQRSAESSAPSAGSSSAASTPPTERSENRPSSKSEEDAEKRIIPEGWATQFLASGVRFLTTPPQADAVPAPLTPSTDTTPEDDIETIADLMEGQEIRLAVFMPDGSALMGDPVWLNDSAGRTGRLTIHPWTGLPVFERLANHEKARDGADESAAHESKDASAVDTAGKPDADDGVRRRASQP